MTLLRRQRLKEARQRAEAEEEARRIAEAMEAARLQAEEEEKARKAAAAAQVKSITKTKKRQDGRVQYKVKYRNGSSEWLDEEHERIQPRHVASFPKRRAQRDLDKASQSDGGQSVMNG